MRHRWPVLALVAGCLAGSPLAAQEVGQFIGDPSPTTWLHVPADFAWSHWKGRLVLVERWRTDSPACADLIPHLNAWHEKLSGRGLSIVGVTHEPGPKVEAFAQHNRMSYALACGVADARGLASASTPHAWLANARGVVIWTGHPKDLDLARIETALEELWLPPNPRLPASMAHVTALFEKGALGEAMAQLTSYYKHPGDPGESAIAQTTMTAITDFGTAQLARVEAAVAAGTFHVALDILDSLVVQFGRASFGERAATRKQALLADEDTALEMVAATAVVAAEASARAGRFDEAMRILAPIARARKYQATQAMLVVRPLFDTLIAQAARAIPATVEAARKRLLANEGSEADIQTLFAFDPGEEGDGVTKSDGSYRTSYWFPALGVTYTLVRAPTGEIERRWTVGR